MHIQKYFKKLFFLSLFVIVTSSPLHAILGRCAVETPLQAVELVAAFLRGSASKIEYDLLIQSEAEITKNNRLLLACISGLRVFHAVIAEYNHPTPNSGVYLTGAAILDSLEMLSRLKDAFFFDENAPQAEIPEDNEDRRDSSKPPIDEETKQLQLKGINTLKHVFAEMERCLGIFLSLRRYDECSWHAVMILEAIMLKAGLAAAEAWCKKLKKLKAKRLARISITMTTDRKTSYSYINSLNNVAYLASSLYFFYQLFNCERYSREELARRWEEERPQRERREREADRQFREEEERARQEWESLSEEERQRLRDEAQQFFSNFPRFFQDNFIPRGLSERERQELRAEYAPLIEHFPHAADALRRGEHLDNIIHANPESLLGIDQNATQHDANIAYRRLSLRYHPDRFRGDPALANRIQQILNLANQSVRNHQR